MATKTSKDQNLTEKITGRVGEALEGAAEQMESAVDRAAELAGSGAVAAERTQDIALSFKAALHQSMRDQPRATLAGAAILGFVVGALWKLSR
jgi:hypothetical protein